MRLSLKPIIETPTEWKIPNVTESRIHIRVNLTTRLLPPSTKGVVLREVSAVTWVDHTIECCVVIIKVSVLVIIFTPEFRELLFQGFKYGTLDNHKPCGSVENLYESVRDGSVLGAEINDETRGEHRHVPLVPPFHSLGSLFPHDNLLGVARDGQVVSGLYESHDGGWVEMDIGVDKHEIFTICLLHESTDGYVTSAVDE